MKQKVLFILLAFFLVSPLRVWAENWTYVSSEAELSDALNRNDKYIRLTNDIVLKTSEVQEVYGVITRTTQYTSYSGLVLDGKKNDDPKSYEFYAIKNIKSALFKELDGVTVQNLIIQDSHVEDGNRGILSKSAKGNCVFQNIFLYNIDNSYTRSSGIGGLIGDATDCTFTNIIAYNVDIRTDEDEVGCIVGKAENCTFKSCVTNPLCSVYAEGEYDNAYAGGICGYAKGCTLEQCTNYALVCGNDDRMGGIVGNLDSSTMTECGNYGHVLHASSDDYATMRDQITEDFLRNSAYEYGIPVHTGFAFFYGCAGTVVSSLAIASIIGNIATRGVADILIDTVIGSVASHVLIVTLPIVVSIIVAGVIYGAQEPDEVGGLAGHAGNGSTIKACVNSGAVSCSDAYCGGIVGYLKGSTVIDCINQGMIYADEQVGGIVGMNDNATVQRCLSLAAVTCKSNKNTYGFIQGDSSDESTCNNNVVAGSEDYDDSVLSSVSATSMASGQLAVKLNQYASDANATQYWRQNVGTDLCPLPLGDGKLVKSGDVNTNVNIYREISTVDELQSALYILNAHVRLTADIDMGGGSFVRSSCVMPFEGEIDGQGHTLANIKNRYTEETSGTGIFAFARGATFRNLNLADVHTQQSDDTKISENGLLVGISVSCTYDHINVGHGSSISAYGMRTGCLAGSSTQDTFNYCFTDKTVTVSNQQDGTQAAVGGLAGQCSGSTFTYCHNAATVTTSGKSEYAGGLAGIMSDGSAVSCMNSGAISAYDNVGGIFGATEKASYQFCMNCGTITGGNKDFAGGLVGHLVGSDNTVAFCLAFGAVNNVSGGNGHLWGACEKSNYQPIYSVYCLKKNGVLISTEEGQLLPPTEAELSSGCYTYYLNGRLPSFYSGKWYQSIDNNVSAVHYPSPLPSMGVVYENHQCNGTTSYSNLYQGATGHAANTNGLGVCTECGKLSAEAPTDITIHDAQELCDLSYAVGRGLDYANSTITLADDIDMTGIEDFMPIGVSQDLPFRGTFDGNMHRIKNLKLASTSRDGTGLFGCVSGTTSIRNLIIDASCSINAVEGTGTAGIVGCLTSPKGSTDQVSLTLDHCGNEATVRGYENAAGLVGGVYNNDNSYLVITNCYNTGSIYGVKISAALVGYGRKHLDVERCWNTGVVTGTMADHAMMHCYDESSTDNHFDKNYQLNGCGNDSQAHSVSSLAFALGYVASNINESAQKWSQNIGTDLLPVFSDEGIRHERAMTNRWGTAILPFTATSDDDVQLYQISSLDLKETEGTLTLETVESVKANVPFFFRKKDENAATICFTNNSQVTIPQDPTTSKEITRVTRDTQVEGWTMTGTYAEISDLTDVYYIANNQAWYAEDSIQVNPFRAYFTHAANGQQAPCRTIALFDAADGETNQIGEIDAEGHVRFFDTPVYDINGKRQSSQKSGNVYIMGGQKVLIR